MLYLPDVSIADAFCLYEQIFGIVKGNSLPAKRVTYEVTVQEHPLLMVEVSIEQPLHIMILCTYHLTLASMKSSMVVILFSH